MTRAPMLLAGLALVGLTVLAGCPPTANKSVPRPKPTQTAPTAKASAPDPPPPTADRQPTNAPVARAPVHQRAASPFRVGDRLEQAARIEFLYGKARIRSRSYPILDDIAAVLKKHPEVTLVEIQRHSDNTIQYYGRRPTQRRAMAVRLALIERGVAPERLVAKGYGETRPIATNKTKEGRAKNRRTEIVVMKMR